MTETHRLYHDLAWIWPTFSPPGEYAEDAQHFRDALRERLGSGRHSILELGSGGGHTLSHLTADFEMTASDISTDMLALSQRLNPGVRHHQGDMRTLRLSRTFDAVIIHDAISYMLTEEDLVATFTTARSHLEPGGVLVIMPDYFQESFAGPKVLHWICQEDSTNPTPPLTVIEYCHDPDQADTTIESLFIFIMPGTDGLRIEQDRHVTGLFSSTTWLRLLTEAGFEAEIRPLPGYHGGYAGQLVVATLMQLEEPGQ